VLAPLFVALSLAGPGPDPSVAGIRPEFSALGTVPIHVGGRRVHPNRLLVKADRRAFEQTAAAGFIPKRYFPQIGWGIVERGRRSLTAAHRILVATPGVRRVEFDRTGTPAYTPNDANWANQWSMRRLNLESAWDRHLGGPEGIVAVMDTGVNTSHEDLVANLWRNPAEIAGNGLDDDGNGYVDDVFGYDFVGEDAVPNDVHGHGTACAGLAAAVGNNAIGVSGAAPRGRIMSLKAAQDDGYFYLSNNLPAYLYAADNGARVLSMSFYSDSLSEAERDAIEYAWSRNVVLVAAAGNDSTIYPYYPAAYERTIAVAATTNTSNNLKASFSDWGSWVDVAAPGVSCATTVTNGGYTNGFAGTSAACPHVAGVAALLIGADPTRPAQAIRNAIEDTARPLVEGAFGEYTNYGLVDADAALRTLLDGPPPPRRKARMLWASPIGTSSSGKTMRLEGRTLDPAGTRVFAGRTRLAAISAHRERRDVVLTRTSRTFTVESAEFGPLMEVSSPEPSGLVWPLIEGSSTTGGIVTGGFLDTLRFDRQAMKVTRRNSADIFLQATFRQTDASAARLIIRRRYQGLPPAPINEKIQLYDWSSASYPYGGWVTLSDSNAPTAWTTSVLTLGPSARYIDYEGVMYLRIFTASAVLPGGALEIDAAYLTP
jgi:hypothetical protein